MFKVRLELEHQSPGFLTEAGQLIADVAPVAFAIVARNPRRRRRGRTGGGERGRDAHKLWRRRQ